MSRAGPAGLDAPARLLQMKAELLQRRLPLTLAAAAFFIVLVGSVMAGRPSDHALALALGSFLGFWLIARTLSRYVAGALGGPPRAHGVREPPAEESD